MGGLKRARRYALERGPRRAARSRWTAAACSWRGTPSTPTKTRTTSRAVGVAARGARVTGAGGSRYWIAERAAASRGSRQRQRPVMAGRRHHHHQLARVARVAPVRRRLGRDEGRRCRRGARRQQRSAAGRRRCLRDRPRRRWRRFGRCSGAGGAIRSTNSGAASATALRTASTCSSPGRRRRAARGSPPRRRGCAGASSSREVRQDTADSGWAVAVRLA